MPGLIFHALLLQLVVLACVLRSLLYDEQQMQLVLRVVTPCFHDTTAQNRCNVCWIAFFFGMLAIAFLVIGHIVGLVRTVEKAHVSS